MNDVHLHMLRFAQLLQNVNGFYETQEFITKSVIDYSGPPNVKRHYFSIKTGSAITQLLLQQNAHFYY
jgi:hypothetical protein